MSVRCAVLVFFVALPRLVVWVWCVIHIVARPDLKDVGEGPLEHWQPGLAGYRRPFAYLFSWKRHGRIFWTKAWEGKSAEEIEDAVFHSTNTPATDRSGETPLV
jgi:hypothetical protein